MKYSTNVTKEYLRKTRDLMYGRIKGETVPHLINEMVPPMIEDSQVLINEELDSHEAIFKIIERELKWIKRTIVVILITLFLLAVRVALNI